MNMTNIALTRPQAITQELDVFVCKRKSNAAEALQMLRDGHYVLIADYYSTGLSLLRMLKDELESHLPHHTYDEQREFRSTYRKLSHQIIVPIAEHKIALRKAPSIGWLKILYPDIEHFALPFPVLQGLNSAWQWYTKGVETPVLEHKLFPYYGVYFPTRFEHLRIFDRWLQKYKGKKGFAYDIGTGSGILTFQMLRYGFRHITATDHNPNAIAGMQEEIKRRHKRLPVSLLYGDLFAGSEPEADLIVFNPPWLPATYQAQDMDSAMYYDEDLFPRFFAEAVQRLKPEGKILIFFSNLAKIHYPDVKHPIEEELKNARRFVKDSVFKKSVLPASAKTRRNQHWRRKEVVELWQLSLHPQIRDKNTL